MNNIKRLINRILVFLRLRKPKYVTGKHAKLLINGHVVAYWPSSVRIDMDEVAPIQTLGNLEIEETEGN